ncbi:hypothetical protein G9P44_003865 [Scheffersomyces stipitis]|nr:hypothetical protein G9P44_003865 [Scheffersomyces stipitis]
MQAVSPIFPASSLSLYPATSNPEDQVLIPQLPEKPSASTGSILVYIIPAEKNLYVQGFEAEEYSQRPPTLLRGCLLVRVLKSSKIKSITLRFSGEQRTDWPEGIPPKKQIYAETNYIVSHTWPFFQQGSGNPQTGADLYRELPKNDGDVSSLSLDSSVARSVSPMGRERDDSPSVGASAGAGSFLARNLSPASNFKRRYASPSVSSMDRDSFGDLTSILSSDNDPSKPGTFAPGDYIYNFEHPLPPSTPESCSVTFGSVHYCLEANIVRPGTFKSNMTARLPIEIIRTPAEQNLEENESIVITRDWEDQLRYDIVIGAKSIVLDSYLPLAFRFVPLWGKVALHRIRVYLTENLEYYCSNKKVHRMEPARKYLLLEHKAEKGKSLLSKDSEEENHFEDVLPKELEFQLFVPKSLNDRSNHEIHPDTSYDNIQSHHWIKICLRISKQDESKPDKRKHYEISIDSPLRVLSPLAAHGNTLLPAYDDFVPGTTNPRFPTYSNNTPPLSPGVTPVDNTTGSPGFFSVFNKGGGSGTSTSLDAVMSSSPPQASLLRSITSSNNNDEPIERDADMHLEANLYSPVANESSTKLSSPQAVPHPGTFNSPLNSPVQRPIHLLRRPSTNPPPFEADSPPPTFENLPPTYEESEQSLSMSPLRIDVPSVNNTNRMHSNSFNGGETPVKDSLQQQLRRKRRSDTSTSASDSSSNKSRNDSSATETSAEANAAMTSRTESTTDITDVTIATPELPQASSPIAVPARRNSTSTIVADTLSIPAKSIPIPIPGSGSRSLAAVDAIALSSSYSSQTGPQDNSEDIVDYPSSPIRLPSSPIRALSPVRGNQSRRSSASSIGSNETDLPIDQTMPLLSLSNSSLVTNVQSNSRNGSTGAHGFKERNSSLSSLMYDLSVRRASQTAGVPATIFDYGGESATVDFYKMNNLMQLRNPRIKKHYQEEDSQGPIEASLSVSSDQETIGNSVDTNNSDTTIGKPRQKSFGVMPDLVQDTQSSHNSQNSGTSSENSSLIQQESVAGINSSKTNVEQSFVPREAAAMAGVPGFKLGYMIE